MGIPTQDLPIYNQGDGHHRLKGHDPSSLSGPGSVKGHRLLTLSPQVLDLSSANRSELVIPNASLIFLDEFRLAVTPEEPNITGLVVFNTLVPQGYPGYLQ